MSFVFTFNSIRCGYDKKWCDENSNVALVIYSRSAVIDYAERLDSASLFRYILAVRAYQQAVLNTIALREYVNVDHSTSFIEECESPPSLVTVILFDMWLFTCYVASCVRSIVTYTELSSEYVLVEYCSLKVNDSSIKKCLNYITSFFN